MNQESSSLDVRSAPRRPWPLFALLAIFLIPIVLATWWYANQQTRENVSTKNYGALLEPSLPVSLPSGGKTLNPKWRLVHFWSESAPEDAAATALSLRQVHGALADDFSRVERLVISVMPPPQEVASDAGSNTAMLTPNEYNDFAFQFQLSSEPVERRVYLVDPIGNWVLSYPDDFDRDLLLKDIKRLLKLSQIG